MSMFKQGVMAGVIGLALASGAAYAAVSASEAAKLGKDLTMVGPRASRRCSPSTPITR
jgi:hypothetical protein